MSKVFNLIMRKSILYIIGMLFFMVSGLFLLPDTEVFAQENTVYSDGVYRYIIIDEVQNKVKLIGIDKTGGIDEFYIPGKAVINEKEYTVSLVDIDYEYYANEKYTMFYNSVKKLNIADDFIGTLKNPEYAFQNLNTVEFYGKKTPEKVMISISNRSIKNRKHFLFIVPKGTENAYEKVIEFSIFYSVVSDLYEFDIELTPPIVSDNAKDIEYTIFAIDGFIYNVIESAKNGVGKVRLFGITDWRLKKDYLELPEKVSYNGYSYKLTSLRKYSLIGSGARVVVVPDTVTDMESCVFDQDVELLFLSKNCKVIPSALITNTFEDGVYTNIRFVHVPEGVTTLSDYALACTPTNTSSIILPSTIKKVGKQSLYAFKLVTFLNKKPLDKVASAINKGTTVKVNESAIKTFKKVLGNKISVVAAKNIVKTKDLTVNNKEIKINTIKTATIKATLTKGSNETIYWLSTNPDIVEVSSKGVITPKKAGTAYVVAYTRTSGKHKAVKVTVTEATFDDGIFTYRITNPSKKTVTLCEVRPDASVKTLTIPETVKYKNVKYTVTDVVANPDKTSIPLIPEKYSNNKIKKIIFPKSITGKVGYLGVLKSIESITFNGKSAPEVISDWYKDGGILAWQAVIYVPQGCINSYISSIVLSYELSYQETHYGCHMDYNFAEIGKDQVMRFVVDGILYRVTKYAGKKNGEVAVKGIDLNLKKVDIKSTVTYNGYTYNVTEIYEGAIKYGNDREINIDKSIKKNTEENYTAPIY